MDSILSWGTKILQAAFAGRLRNKNKDRHDLSHLSFHGNPRANSSPGPLLCSRRKLPGACGHGVTCGQPECPPLTPTENPVPRRRAGPGGEGLCGGLSVGNSLSSEPAKLQAQGQDRPLLRSPGQEGSQRANAPSTALSPSHSLSSLSLVKSLLLFSYLTPTCLSN